MLMQGSKHYVILIEKPDIQNIVHKCQLWVQIVFVWLQVVPGIIHFQYREPHIYKAQDTMMDLIR